MGRPRKTLPPASASDGLGMLAPMAPAALASRLQAEMDRQHITVEQVASRGKISQATVYAILGAESRDLSLSTLYGLSRALNRSLAWVLGEVNHEDAEATTIEVRGTAELGVWKSMALAQEPRGRVADAVPQDDRYHHYPRFGREVRDDSLMGLMPPVPPGAIAIVIDLTGADIAVESGRVYLVHRQNSDGQIESTFRRVTVYRDRYEFDALTADAARNAAEKVVLSREDVEQGKTLRIGGLFFEARYRYL